MAQDFHRFDPRQARVVLLESGERVLAQFPSDRSATIGRAAAVAQIRALHLSGFLAWAAWLGVHIFFLIGFENRVLVLIQWAASYLSYERGARLITSGWHGGAPTQD